MSKQRITKFDLSGFGDSTTSNTSSGVKKFDLSAFEKKRRYGIIWAGRFYGWEF